MKRRVNKSRRSAAILFCVLACMLIATSLLVVCLRGAMRARAETRSYLQVRQAELLCDAGVQRAAIKMKQSDQYTGEVWTPKLTINGDLHPTVAIKITSDNASQQRRVEVTTNLLHSETLLNVQPSVIQRSIRTPISKTTPSNSRN